MAKYRLVLKDTKTEDSDYDYGTGEAKGSDIFDTTKTGMTGSWQDLLVGRDTDYYKNKKNLVGKVVQMSPNEYYKECAKMFISSRHSNSSAEDLKRQRSLNKEGLEDIEKVILEKKKKLCIPVLDISYNPGQEGLHRMMVAGDLFGWDTKFPVLLVETYDKERQERIEKDYAQREFNNAMERIERSMEPYEYYDIEEFSEMIAEAVEKQYDQEPIISISGNNLEVSIYDDEIDDSLIYNIDLNKYNIGGEDEEV